MTRSQSAVGAFPTVAALAVLVSTGAAGAARNVGALGAATADEPALVSPTTFLAVVAAFLLGLLIVAAVRRADR